MISKSLASLLGRAGHLQQLSFSAVLGSIVAISVPFLAWVLGGMLNCLILGRGSDKANGVGDFSTLLPSVSSFLPIAWTPLAKISVLLVASMFVVLYASLLLYLFYRQIQIAAVSFEIVMIEKLRQHARQLAAVRTLSAQQQALTDCLDYHLPRVRLTLSRWWKAYPRHVVQFAVCVLLAILIQPVLAVLTILGAGLVVLVYRFLDRIRRTSLPVVRERASQQRGALVDLSLKGPLLESIHNEAEVERRFAEQLELYRRDSISSLTSSAWKMPVVFAIAGILGGLFLFLIAVQVLRSENGFSVGGALSFALCFVGAAISSVRLQRSSRDLKAIETAVEELERFLSLRVDEYIGDDLAAIERVTQQAELDHVTIQDSAGRKLLENVCAVFRPGQLIGVVSPQKLPAHALVELLMGLGRPVSGRLLIDGVLVSDLKPSSLARCGHWVAADGAVATGSVRDNLVGSAGARLDVELQDRITSARLTEVVQQLPEGLQTVITPGDDRLTGDAPFRLGIARAGLRNASVVIIEEPEGRFDQQMEQQTLDAIRSLVCPDVISVVLPQRLSTLRQCDLVIMLHDHKVADTGTHADLLQRNELYRHLNYLKYNPFRNVPQSALRE